MNGRQQGVMIEPKTQLQVTEIENGWLVGSMPITNPQNGQVIRQGTIQYAATYEDLCQILKGYFPPIVV